MSTRLVWQSVFSAVIALYFFNLPTNAQQLINVDTEKTFKANEKRRKQLQDGQTVEPATDKAVIENAAEYYVYRVTWLKLENAEWKSGMGLVQSDFKLLMEHRSTLDGKNDDFMKHLAPALITCLKKVFEQEKDFKTRYTAVTNAALMLPLLAKCRQDKVHDYLMELAKPDKDGKPTVHPFIRMCAIKGLGEFNAPGGPLVGIAKSQPALQPARDAQRLDVIASYIVLPYPPQGQGPEYDNAFVYARREGVKALAQYPLPAVEIKKGEPVKSPAAYYLMYVANGGAFPNMPPVTLSEKVEAAIGLCNLRTSQASEYNAELAAFIVGRVLVEFANAYREDHAYFSVKEKDKEAPARLALLPWQSYAQRLEAGLEKMAKESKVVANKFGDKKAGDFASTARDMLRKVQIRGAIEPPQALESLAAALQPPVFEVYAGNDLRIELPKK